MSAQKVSITDIAESAGVSVATVSRIMNGKSGSAKGTCARVKKIARSLGYTCKNSDPLYPCNKIKNISFVTAGFTPQTIPYHSVLLDVLHGVEKTLSQKGINLLFVDAESLSSRSSFSQPDGIIIMGAGIDAELLGEIENHPCICILPNLQNIRNLPTINHDDEEIGRIAFDYLTNKGHKEISILNFVCNHSGCQKRVRTFEWLAAENGIKIKIFEAAGSTNSTPSLHINFADDCMNHFIHTLKNKTNRSTALFSVCDLQTSYLYTALREAGMEPMRDIDIISCDNEKSILAPLHPKPATIDIRAEFIGRKAAEILLWQIQNFSTILNEPLKILIMPKLMIP